MHAVDGVSYHLDEHEIVGLVGESGCGKSASQLAVMRLTQPPGRIVGGKVLFGGEDLAALREERSGDARRARRKIAMIFQEPMTSLNPVLTVGDQLAEALRIALPAARKAEARERAVELLRLVGIPGAGARLDDYPHQFCGGMRQRVMIAMALVLQPARAHRRRAHHRARRDHPGTDPRSHGGSGRASSVPRW